MNATCSGSCAAWKNPTANKPFSRTLGLVFGDASAEAGNRLGWT
jgi:hypothetical protein